MSAICQHTIVQLSTSDKLELSIYVTGS